MWDDAATSGGEGGGNHGPVYWRSCPEFSHLATYNPPSNSSSSEKKEKPLKEKIKELLTRAKNDKEIQKEVRLVLMNDFLAFLSRTLGFAPETFDTSTALGMYGLDSLSAVGVQYWVWRGVCFFHFLFFFLSAVFKPVLLLRPIASFFCLRIALLNFDSLLSLLLLPPPSPALLLPQVPLPLPLSSSSSLPLLSSPPPPPLLSLLPPFETSFLPSSPMSPLLKIKLTNLLHRNKR